MINDQKILLETALAYCKAGQNPLTGYLHGGGERGGNPGTISITENWLFALALVRSRQVEACEEAQRLMEKLLAYRSAVGNSPLFLHEYPHCPNRYLGIELLPIFYQLLTRDKQGVGSTLCRELEATAQLLVPFALESEQQRRAPYPLLMTIAGVAVAFGRHLSKSSWVRQGEELLDYLLAYGEVESWYIPNQLGRLLIALQCAFPALEESPWMELVRGACRRWDPRLRTSVGPAIEEYFLRGEPELTAFDCFMVKERGLWCPRTKKPALSHLEALLIRPVAAEAGGELLEGMVGRRRWRVQHTSAAVASVVEQPAGLTAGWKGKQAFRCYWGEELHSLVLQLPYWGECSFHASDGEITLLITFREGPDLEEKEREVCFYLDKRADAKIFVGGHAATTFSLDEELLIEGGSFRCSLAFSLVSGEGRFIGHLMPGDRPGEREPCGRDRQIFLRTLERSAPCVIAVKFKAEPV